MRVHLSVDEVDFLRIERGDCNRIAVDRDVASYIIKNNVTTAAVICGYPSDPVELARRITAIIFSDAGPAGWVCLDINCRQCRQYKTCTIFETCDGVYYAKNASEKNEKTQ